MEKYYQELENSYAKYYKKVVGLIKKKSYEYRSNEEIKNIAQDIVQTSAAIVLVNLHEGKYDESQSFEKYFLGICYNALMRFFKEETKGKEINWQWEEADIQGFLKDKSEEELDEDFKRMNNAALVQYCLDRIGETYNKVLKAYYWAKEDIAWKKVAEILGFSTNSSSINVTAKRGLILLRSCLEKKKIFD